MFSFFKKKSPEVVFECENWATRTYSPIRPAREFFPEKFKALPTTLTKGEYQKTNISTIRICPGLRDYMSNGFVMPAWCDMHIKIIDGVPEITYSDFDIEKMYHFADQMGDFLDTKFLIRTPVKLDNPWITYTKKGWSILWLPMSFHENPYFEAIPGIIDHDKGPGKSPINIMLKTDESFTIEQGTPIVQMVPFKRQIVTAYTGNLRDKTIDRYKALMTTNGLTKYLKRITKKHFGHAFSSQIIRILFAKHNIKGLKDAITTQKLLGHSNLDSTLSYAKE